MIKFAKFYLFCLLLEKEGKMMLQCNTHLPLIFKGLRTVLTIFKGLNDASQMVHGT